MFDSEAHRLRWLIHEVERRTNNADIELFQPELMDVFVVSSLWLERCLTHTKAILVLITQDLAPAIGPLQRVLWELWVEWRYFLRQPDRALAAAKVTLNASIEALEFAEELPGRLEVATLDRIRRSVQEYESRHPRASSEIRQQRKERRYHWSGMTRSRLERVLAGNATAYQYLSWEAHGVMGPIRDVSVELKDGIARLGFGRRENDRDVNRHAWMSGGVLYYIYNDFAKLWGLHPIVVPTSDSKS